jgi:Ser/Thr protein kinase RdoA (MazF antagonist)
MANIKAGVLHSKSLQDSVVAQGGLAASYRSMPDVEAVDLVRQHYGIVGHVDRLATEKDDTFRVDDGAGRRFILKVANPLEDVSEISCQIEVLKHIARRDPQLPVPRVIADIRGDEQFEYQDRAGQRRWVRLLSYLEGVPLSEIVSTAPERECIGETFGRLRLALVDFAHPADGRVLAWDVKHLMQLGDLLEAIDDGGQRQMLQAGLERFATLEGRLSACRTQVVHNDFSKSNVVVDRATAGFVTGVIDFGDAVRTLIAIDVSTALLNQLPSSHAEDLFADARDLLRGYLRVADLTDEELRLIPHLVMARAVTRALLSIWRAKLFPENSAYLLRNTEQGWVQLRWFLSRSVEQVSDTLFNHAARAGNIVSP